MKQRTSNVNSLGDRVDYVPSHDGPLVFPNFGLFSKLIRYANQTPCPIAIRDHVAGTDSTFLQLLTDALALRSSIRASLDPKILDRLERDQEVYICILAPGSYEFAVAVVAILALGAAAVPLSTALPVQEAEYFVLSVDAVAILSSSRAEALARSLEAHLQTKCNVNVKTIPIAASLRSKPLPPSSIVVSSNRHLDPNGAGAVIFTSGTTGAPKGAVQRRSYATDSAQALADDFGVTFQDTLLHVFPVHHATGTGISFLPFLIAGACIEFRSGSFSPEWMWNRVRQGGLTFFSGVPTMYMRLRQYHQQYIAKLPSAERQAYVHGCRQIKTFLCGTSALSQSLQDFWTNIRGGRPISIRYGSTELHVVAQFVDAKGIPQGSIGPARSGVEMKLSEGNESEILVKSPYMFSRYLNDPEATAAAHNNEGYFKTGDIVRREGRNYFILGRASVDIIKSGGYKISALDIEREVLALPYVAEVMVVGVPDDEFGQRVASAVVLDNHSSYPAPSLTIDALRRDLRSQIAGYKMPTLLRVVPELPKNVMGKVPKKALGLELFPPEGHPNVQSAVRNKGTAKL